MRHNGKKVDPNAYYAIELFGKHTTGCEVIQKNDKKEKNGAVTKTKSGAINILNAMMKSPQLIEVYKQKKQWRVNKETKEMIWKIVHETFQEVHNVHLDVYERTFFNYLKKIKAEEGVERR